MASKVNRRDFLKLSAAALAGLAFRDFPPGGERLQDKSSIFPLGRTVHSLRYYWLPSPNSEELGFYNTDTVVNILQETSGDPWTAHNSMWLRSEDGWFRSEYVQPVKNELNFPTLNIPAGGMLVEVTVPYTQSYVVKGDKKKHGYRFYYKSTHWVHNAYVSSNGIIWYMVLDDLSGDYAFVNGSHLRPIMREELTPISPDVRDKGIKVDLKRQRVTAYEGNRPVFTCLTSTGYYDGTTPRGEFRVERKQPSEHMTPFEGNRYDLPGVPWVCYISWTGVSLHGTYWHNNYGTPESSGCINLTPEDALWFYRWTDPYVPPGEDYVETSEGTRVVVF
ncbi:MAG: L,D-transpeptidase family protein [Desulfobacteraceae bacterium]|nr:L,D-transpeptidase family protein [Desulfobacteraceae bacterium]